MSEIMLSDFLSEGSVIRSKHEGGKCWTTNLVCNIDRDVLEIDIGLEKDYTNDILMIGDTVRCKCLCENAEYNFLGSITSVKAEFPQTITLEVAEVDKFENKRASYRYDVYLSAAIKISEANNKGIFAILTNISKTGAAFVVSEEIQKLLELTDFSLENDNVFAEIYIDPQKTLKFEGKVVRKYQLEKGIDYGIQIVNIDSQNQKVFDEFLSELENKDKEFFNRRSGFWFKNSKFNKL